MSRNNLKKIRELRNVSQTDLATQLSNLGYNISKQAIWAFENEKSNISPEKLQKIAEVLNCSLDDIFSNKQISSANSKYFEIPFCNVEVSAGGGVEVQDEFIDSFIKISKDFLTRIGKKSISNLNFVVVNGNSMAPLYRDEDIVLVDRSSTEIQNNGVYVIRKNNSLFIKRLILNEIKGTLSIVSDNNKEINGRRVYPDTELTAEEVENQSVDFVIVGKVIWKSGFEK